ncbi:MAG: hypothetical protein ACXVPX_10185 [Actinomycetota bacterium]
MRRRALGLAVLASVSIVVLGASPAFAHEEREVGKYHFAVGFGSEPAYAGQLNSVQLFLHDVHDKPVTELKNGLKVSVEFGGQSQSFAIEPDFEVGEFGIPGDYRAWFIPTRSGQYSFHFTGTVNGQPVDETFTSGPKTFSDVVDPTGVEFPVQDPTVGQLSERIQREVPRLDASIGNARTAASSASDDASSATTFAIVALVVGALGLAVGVVSLVRSRRPA